MTVKLLPAQVEEDVGAGLQGAVPVPGPEAGKEAVVAALAPEHLWHDSGRQESHGSQAAAGECLLFYSSLSCRSLTLLVCSPRNFKADLKGKG